MNNLLYGIQSKNFMKEDEFRLFFDDGLIFLNEVIYFTPDMQRMVYKLCDKFEIEYNLAETFMNFPLIDKMMFNIGERFSEKMIQVGPNCSTTSNSQSTRKSHNWKILNSSKFLKCFPNSTTKPMR